MLYKKYKFELILAFAILLALILSLWLIIKIEMQKPEIVGIEEIQGEINNADLVEQKIVFKTNRIVDSQTLNSIQIEPTVNFGASAFENRIIINFSEPLKSDQKYLITFRELKDVYGNLFEDSEFEFKTSSLNLAFLDIDRKSIKKASLDLEKIETIYNSDKTIKFYKVFKNKLIVVTDGDLGSEIWLIDKDKKLIVDVRDKVVNAITASDNFEKIFFVAGDALFVDGEILPSGVSELYELDFKTGIYSLVRLPKEIFSDIVTVELTPDGSAVLVKNVDSTFFLVNILDYSKFVELGKYLDISDFNRNEKLYLALESPFGASFANFPYITIIDSNSNKTALTDGDVYVLDPKFFGQDIVYSSKVQEIEGLRGLFGIKILNSKTLESKDLFAIEQKSVELPIVSPDLDYIAVEIYTQDELKNFENLRNKGFQSKPGSAEIGIYDFKQQKLFTKDVKGVEVVWIY